MSHFKFHSEPVPFDTRHGNGYVGIGESDSGVESIAIVGAGDDSTDLHLSADQAVALAETLLDYVTTIGLHEAARPSLSEAS